MNAPLIVADFDLGDARPNVRELVNAAVERGAQFLAVDVVDGEDETPEAHVANRRVATLERMTKEALRGGLGLVLRLHDTLPLPGLRDALGVEKGSSAAASRARFLVVVGKERVGKRLRREAPELPSGYEMAPTPERGLARFRSANFQRATADADDLVVPWGRIGPAKLAARIAPDLARRGGRLWISALAEADLPTVAALPAAGLLVRCRLAGSRLRI